MYEHVKADVKTVKLSPAVVAFFGGLRTPTPVSYFEVLTRIQQPGSRIENFIGCDIRCDIVASNTQHLKTMDVTCRVQVA